MDPALAALHEKLLLFEALKVAVPNTVSVTVTAAPLGEVVKPTPEHPLPVIAVLKFPANVEAVLLFTNVPVNVGAVPEQLAEPLVPAVSVPHVNTPVTLPLTVKALTPAPGYASVTVTVLVLVMLEKPTDAAQLIAVLRLPATVVVLLLFTKAPVNVGAVPVQEADPAVPAVTVPHEKPLPLAASVKVRPFAEEPG